jgi:hypothetical protein
MWQGEGDPPTVANFETGWQGLPRPYDFILADITKWDKVIKKHDKDTNIDWEARAKADLASIDREQKALTVNAEFMSFTSLIAFMGFNEGLATMAEEPESVKELLNFMVIGMYPLWRTPLSTINLTF